MQTEFMIIGSRQRVNATQDNIDTRIDDREIKRVHSAKTFRVTYRQPPYIVSAYRQSM